VRKLVLASFCVLTLTPAWFVCAQSKKPASSGKGQSPVQLTARQIADRALRSVVLVVTTDEKGQPISQGSGFIFRPGLVVTNLHVFARATKAFVKSVGSGERHFAVEVVGMNARYDLCVIRIADRSIPSLPLAAAGEARTGDEVYVASNPEGLEGSVTKGIVSSLRIEAGLLQIDAAISPGSSGGAVINQRGEAVGIVKSSLVDGQNLNFAIPTSYLKSLSLDFKLPVIVAGACAYRDRDRDKLKGLVKSVVEKKTIVTYDTNTGKRKEAVVPSTRVYDIDGNMVEFRVYGIDARGEVGLDAKQMMTYDENRFLTQLIETAGDERILTRRTFSPDQSLGRKLANRTFSGTFDIGEYGTKTYDSEGNMTEWLIRGQRNVYTYERDGRMKECSVYQENSSPRKSRYLYEDDNAGNWIVMREEEFSTEDGWVQTKVTYRDITYFK